MRDQSARTRTGLNPPVVETGTGDPRVRVTLAHLRSLDGRARSLSFLPRQPSGSVLNGRHASRLRGRGLNFEELRDYLPGDDPRTIDWKVTARTGAPHVRVYTEERDRPALVVVDQRMSMFFGTRNAMKSVTAAETAALAAFRILDQGDRIGGVVFGDEQLTEIRPQRSRRTLDRLLRALADANQSLRADAPHVEPMTLNEPLKAVSRIARRNHLVIIVSDFDGTDEETRRLINGLARRNDVVLCPVTDPIAHEMPDGLKITVSDGRMQAEIDTGTEAVRRSLESLAAGRLAELLAWQRETGLAILPLSAGEDTLPQIRRLMGLSGGRR
ncbi:DUF58 domain-containing protein [Roseibium sp.]|uniref:DUF58 domain-containing protein n=1 Tax=Roseibium sp. TaxID=1936156 RepID=UPI003A973B31